MKTTEKMVNGIRVFEMVLEDCDMASTELRESRLSVCNTCEFIVNNDSCVKCSCLLVNRVSYAESFCPEGKW